jgi:hypothetical protein
MGEVAAFAQFSGNTAVVRDAPGNRIRSDGGGIYVDGERCVAVTIAKGGGGFFQLRTVSNVYTVNNDGETPCNSQDWNDRRTLTLDFGLGFTVDLDGRSDDDPNGDEVEDVPARFIAERLYHKKAATTPVTILILTVQSDGTTTQETAFELRYVNQARIQRGMGNQRTIALSGNAAEADLSRYIKKRKRTILQYLGTFEMPFEVTADSR